VKKLLGKAFELPDRLWTRLNLYWVLFFVVQAVANVVVAANFSEATWVNFKTFGDVALMVVFMGAQFYWLRDYLIEPQAEPATVDASEVPEGRAGD